MKGLEIAREFFFEWGQPFIETNFPDLTGRIAAGRLSGSDVLGGDDELSRDHGWGPQFTVFLSDEDYQKHGEALSSAMNAAAPNPWNGTYLGGGDKSVTVVGIGRWFREVYGMPHPPSQASDWMNLSESGLHFIRHGAIWVDGTGEMETWRKSIRQYPPEILAARLSVESFRIWQHGEYNFVQRMAKRRDPLAIAICLAEFLDGVMRIVLLLDGNFTPYWKWLAFEFRKSPSASYYAPLLEQLVASRDIDEQVSLVTTICANVHDKLVASGAVSGEPGNPWLLPLYKDHIELVELNRKNGLDSYRYNQ